METLEIGAMAIALTALIKSVHDLGKWNALVCVILALLLSLLMEPSLASGLKGLVVGLISTGLYKTGRDIRA